MDIKINLKKYPFYSMCKLNKICGFVALPIIIGSAVLIVGVLGGLAYEYKNNQSILSSVNKNNLLAQVSGVITTPCTDSDGGRDYYVKGIVSGVFIAMKDYPIMTTETDFCLSSSPNTLSNTLVEYYCKDDFIYSEHYTCSNGCENGACKQTTTSSITVLSPNGGESWKTGEEKQISWDYQGFVPRDIRIYLYSPIKGNVYTLQLATIGGNISSQVKSYTMQLGQTLEPGDYKITICDENQDSPDVSGKPLCDSSDNYFTISAPTTFAPSITRFSPTSGSAGTKLQVYGTNLNNITSVTLTQRLCCKYYAGTSYPMEWSPVSNTEFGVPIPSITSGDYFISMCTSSGCTTPTLDGPVFTIIAPQPTCSASTSCVAQYCQYGGDLKKCTIKTICSTSPDMIGSSSYTTGSCSSAPTCTTSTSCVAQYCQYGGDLKKCTVKKADCSTSSYATGGCNSAPSDSSVCDSTAKAIVDSIGGCTKIDKSLYSNIYKVCCESVVVTKETLLSLLNAALADRVISDAERTALLTALNSYLK